MKTLLSVSQILCFACSFFCSLAFAVDLALPLASDGLSFSKKFQELNLLETKFNHHYIDYKKTRTVIQLQHFLIPLKFLELERSQSNSENIDSSLLTSRNGITYLRWVLHPEDHRGVKEVMAWLQQNDLPIIREKYFLGLETASRSFLVLDPETGKEFSLKTSTDMIGGRRIPAKMQTWIDAKNTLQISDYIKRREKLFSGFHNFEILEEPIAFGIADINRATLIRSYAPLLNSNFNYVPAFSALNSEYGRWLAKKNGSDNPSEFWNEHLNKALARAYAELFVKTGLVVDSPHSQNFLIQLDADMRPTGKIVFRDIGDVYFVAEYFNAEMTDLDLLRRQPKEQVQKTGKLQLRIALLHYLWPPNWLDRFSRELQGHDAYDRWGEIFYSEFKSEVTKLTGLSLTASRAKPIRTVDTFANGYVLNDERAGMFFQNLKSLVGRVEMCSKIFSLAN